MKRLLALALASAVLTTPAFAEKDACKGVQLKKDSFGSVRYFEAGELTLKVIEGKWTLQLGMNKGGGYGGFATMNLEQLAAGSAVEVLFEDGSSAQLTTSAPAGGQFVSIMGVSTTHYEVPIQLDVDAIKGLIAQPIKAYRVVVNGETWAKGEVSKGDAAKFIETATCMIGT